MTASKERAQHQLNGLVAAYNHLCNILLERLYDFLHTESTSILSYFIYLESIGDKKVPVPV